MSNTNKKYAVNLPNNLTTMALTDVVTAVATAVTKGTFHTIKFFSIVDGSGLAYGPRKNPTADPRPMVKISELQCRMGIDHKNTQYHKNNVAQNGAPTFHPNLDVEYLVSEALLRNRRTDNYLLDVVPRLNGVHNTKYFELDGTPIDEATVLTRLNPNKHTPPPETMRINAKQIFSIN